MVTQASDVLDLFNDRAVSAFRPATVSELLPSNRRSGSLGTEAIGARMTTMKKADHAAESTVTVYTKPDCVQCDATKRTLNKHGIPFIEIDLSANADALDRLKAAGWM